MNLFPFNDRSSLSSLPSGFVWESDQIPSPVSLNRLLARCNEETHPSKRLALAMEKSSFCLSIIEEKSGCLAGFVRVTSDNGLNANLWNLVAEPGDFQDQLIEVLVNRAMGIIRRTMPGCSVSISAPLIAIQALQKQGFLVDPSGIRAMGLRLRS